MKILIIRFSSLGDLAMATALPRVLRNKFPDAQIDMVVRNDMRHVIEWNPYITNKIFLEQGKGFKGLKDLTQKIKDQNYDIIIDAHRSLRSRYICLNVIKPKKFFFDKRTIKRLILIYLKINLFKKILFNMEEYIKPLNKIGVYYDGKGTEIFIPDQTKEKVDKILLQKLGSDYSKKILIGIVPSAQWPGKRWSVDSFRKLVKMISDKIPNSNIIVVGGKRDLFCNEIADQINRAHSFAGTFSIIESSQALALCDVVIANDTGMMHIAEAVGTDVIGIMGPTSIEFGCYPFRKNSKVVEKNMWCRPCSKNGWGPCIQFGKRPCLNDIKPEDVFQSLQEYLNGVSK